MKYPAKLILIGEYTIIDGGDALAIPYDRFSGSWKKVNDKTDLEAFFKYLGALEDVDSKLLDEAISGNWTFESSIPRGYGAGSSGALTAAAYDTFFHEKELELEELKKKLGLIESFFHGKSSGLDPLISFLKQSLVVKNNSILPLEHFKIPDGFYVYDSGQTRSGKELIQFYQRNKTQLPLLLTIKELKELNASLIDAIKVGNHTSIRKLMKALSHLQFAFFEKMIPSTVKKVWLKGLSSDAYYMKLCGAGGGGFFLVYDLSKEIEGQSHFQPIKLT